MTDSFSVQGLSCCCNCCNSAHTLINVTVSDCAHLTMCKLVADFCHQSGCCRHPSSSHLIFAFAFSPQEEQRLVLYKQVPDKQKAKLQLQQDKMQNAQDLAAALKQRKVDEAKAAKQHCRRRL